MKKRVRVQNLSSPLIVVSGGIDKAHPYLIKSRLITGTKQERPIVSSTLTLIKENKMECIVLKEASVQLVETNCY